MLPPMESFETWLTKTANDRGLTLVDVSREANLGPSTLRNIFKGLRKAGPDVCDSLAKVLDIDPVIVYRRAGILPLDPGGESAIGEDELVFIYRQLDEAGQREALAVIRALREAKEYKTDDS